MWSLQLLKSGTGEQPPETSQLAAATGLAPSAIRFYEARGLIEPARTDGGTRRYSANDVDRLRRISDLLDAGLNLAGIAMVIALETENAQLRADRENTDG